MKGNWKNTDKYGYGTFLDGYGSFENMKNGPYELLWFNCCTGESTTEEIVVENSRFAIPNKPDASDWVVAVQYKV